MSCNTKEVILNNLSNITNKNKSRLKLGSRNGTKIGKTELRAKSFDEIYACSLTDSIYLLFLDVYGDCNRRSTWLRHQPLFPAGCHTISHHFACWLLHYSSIIKRARYLCRSSADHRLLGALLAFLRGLWQWQGRSDRATRVPHSPSILFGVFGTFLEELLCELQEEE